MPAPIMLSPAQLEEFPEGNLARFAEAYIAFQRSSPCTAEGASFPYFDAPSAADMDEDDVLFGPDRNLAYKKLMWAFRKCQRSEELRRYFDPAHNQYWESRTVPGLVLLKEWAYEPVPRAGLYTGSFRDIRPENYDEIWLCVRSLKSMPKNPPGNIRHVPVLSPSPELWRWHLAQKRAGKWNAETFRSGFARAFLLEMLKPGPLKELRQLEKASRNGPVLVVCYCSDESVCHRSLLRQIINVMRPGEAEK